MSIEPVLWDSDFFGYPIGRLSLKANESINEEECLNNHYKLIYVFSEIALNLEQLNKLPLELADCKVELEAEVETTPILSAIPVQQIHQLSPQLLDLVYQSGHYSRFKLDNKFVHQEFERLYLAWINKVLNDKQQQVIGYMEQDKPIGFITVEEKNANADIGLIAVDELYRGKSIGHHLIQQSHKFAQEKNLKSITVTTQLANAGAMRFYQYHGFKVAKKSYIYHLWK